MLRTIAFALLLTFINLNGLAAEDGPTRIHLDQYNGYFSSETVFMNLEPGEYVFTVTNRAGKLAGFLLTDGDGDTQLALGLIEDGETGEFAVTITDDGFRYRCPINPTPWYDVSVSSAGQ